MSENGGRGRVTGTRRTHLPSQASNEAEGGTDDHLLHHGRLQTPQELRGREKRKERQQSFLPPSAQPARQPLDAGIRGRGRAALREPAATSSRSHGLKSWSKPWSRVRRAWGQRKRRKRKERKRGERDGERTFTAVLAKTCGALIAAGVVMIFPLFHSPPFRATGFNFQKKPPPPPLPLPAQQTNREIRLGSHTTGRGSGARPGHPRGWRSLRLQVRAWSSRRWVGSV